MSISSKQAGISDIVKLLGQAAWNGAKLTGRGAAYAVRHPIQGAVNTVGAVGSALAVPAVGEFGFKTLNNAMHGKAELGNNSWTGKQLGNAFNFLGERYIGAPINTAVKGALDGAASSPNLQKALDVADRVTDPTTRQGVHDLIVNSASDASHAAAKGLIGGAAEGIGQTMMKQPASTMASSLALGLTPMVAYDLMTRKKREEQERNQQVILNYVKGQQVKTAGALDTLARLASKVKPLMYQPSTIPASMISRLANANGRVHVKDLLNAAENAKLPQTVFNNSFSRNPVKTWLGGTAAIGGGTEGWRIYKGDINDPIEARNRFFKGLAAGPTSILKAMESGAFANDNNSAIVEHPLVKRLGDLKGKVEQTGKQMSSALEQVAPTPSPEPPGRAPSNASTQTVSPASSTPAEQPANWKPYAAAAGVLAAPYAAYSVYDHVHNQEYNRMKQKNQQVATKLVS